MQRLPPEEQRAVVQHGDKGDAVARVGLDAADHGAFVPADELDDLAALMIPPQIAQHPVELMHAEAEALFEHGLRGNTGRSILAKEFSAARMRTRHLQARLDAEIVLLGKGRGDMRRARFFADLVSRQFRMMSMSAELLLRLDTVPQPSFRIDADQAAILVGGSANDRNNGNG